MEESSESVSVENREVFKIKVRSPNTSSAAVDEDMDERLLSSPLIFKLWIILS